MRYIYGLDPASQNDFFGLVIHSLSNDLPKLKDLKKLRHLSFDKMLMILEELFAKYPPYLIVSDYTNEKTFTDILIRRFGKKRVQVINFGTKSKKMLKDDGLAILKQCYKMPNPSRVKDSQKAQWIRDLIDELKHEEMILTRSGKETFDHPTGRHNDLATAWELSIHGCLKFMLNKKQKHIVVSKKFRSYNNDFFGSDIPSGARLLGKTVFMPQGDPIGNYRIR